MTAAAARFRIRAGMTVDEARSRCADLQVLAWDDVAITDAVRRASAALLAASPQVTPVAGAPGLWWIGASGFGATGGEPALASALLAIARPWHPQARVAIADSCVAARAATWAQRRDGTRARRGATNGPTAAPPVLVPPGGCAAYLAPAPLGLLPMDEELRETLVALGLRTTGAFAALAAEDVERRWGAGGLAAWRLARGEDRRRPTLARADVARAASADLVPAVTTMEPVLFLVRAALDRLVRDLVTDGRAAATLAITLTLDDARGAHPGTARAHTITREIRLPRPLARAVPLLERCRALLDHWTLSAAVCGVTVAILATTPLSGDQGDLLDPGWRDPAAADAAFARLRAELGPDAVVLPVARDEHRPERAGAWVTIDDEGGNPGAETRRQRRPDRGHPASGRRRDRPRESTPAGAGRLPVTPALRQLEHPEPVNVECENGTPRVLWWRGRRVCLEQTRGPERLAGDWWKDGYARDYWRCEEAAGGGDREGTLLLFHDGVPDDGAWYVQGWYD